MFMRERQEQRRSILFDNSLAVINRTGAYYIAKDLCEEFVPGLAEVRHWRLGSRAPEGLARKLAARLMMLEITWLGDLQALLIGDRLGGGSFRVFLDPLYVLRSRLGPSDVVLCHDVGPLTHRALYDPRTSAAYDKAYAKISREKPGVVFVSDWSRRQFVALFGADFRFLRTIGLYLRSELLAGPSEPVPGLAPPFLLTVGAFETRKNQVAAIRAFRDGGFFADGVRYVLCGSRGEGHREIAELARGVPGVELLGYASDAQLRWLYANAEAFVLPSLLEGFGMPALEAAATGLLPIVSADSALVEAVGGCCMQVPPTEPAAIARAMRAALERDPGERQATARRLREVAARASRERFVAEWRDLLTAPAAPASVREQIV